MLKGWRQLFEWLFEYCGGCCRWFVRPSRQRLNTAYADEESNFIYCCDDCYQEAYDYYDELWKDYYASRL